MIGLLLVIFRTREATLIIKLFNSYIRNNIDYLSKIESTEEI